MIFTGLFSAILFLSANAAPTRFPFGPEAPGLVFDRYIAIRMENTDFAGAAADPDFAALTKQGLQLTNYFALIHPSGLTQVAAIGGDYFGAQNDNLNMIPQNVSTVVDLLEERGISWAEYAQDAPSSGFQFLNPDGANDYVRKHSPLIVYNSVANDPARAANIKNFTLFERDLQEDRLPQWMFITPNMTNDRHDANVNFASKFAREFLEPLLKDSKFNGPRTLVVLTFDENGDDSGATDPQNRVDTILLGSAVPEHLVGTQDAAFYNHFSGLATVQANWQLSTLGRYDVGANVFSFVAEHTGDVVRALENPPNTSNLDLFNSNPGALAPLPVPNTKLVVNGRSVHPEVVRIWGSPALQASTTYPGGLEVPSAANPPVLPDAEPVVGAHMLSYLLLPSFCRIFQVSRRLVVDVCRCCSFERLQRLLFPTHFLFVSPLRKCF